LALVVFIIIALTRYASPSFSSLLDGQASACNSLFITESRIPSLACGAYGSLLIAFVITTLFISLNYCKHFFGSIFLSSVIIILVSSALLSAAMGRTGVILLLLFFGSKLAIFCLRAISVFITSRKTSLRPFKKSALLSAFLFTSVLFIVFTFYDTFSLYLARTSDLFGNLTVDSFMQGGIALSSEGSISYNLFGFINMFVQGHLSNIDLGVQDLLGNPYFLTKERSIVNDSGYYLGLKTYGVFSLYLYFSFAKLLCQILTPLHKCDAVILTLLLFVAQAKEDFLLSSSLILLIVFLKICLSKSTLQFESKNATSYDFRRLP
jgi:hypothetical protein